MSEADRAREAAEAAISNPLLDDVSLRGARALLINITGLLRERLRAAPEPRVVTLTVAKRRATSSRPALGRPWPSISFRTVASTTPEP